MIHSVFLAVTIPSLPAAEARRQVFKSPDARSAVADYHERTERLDQYFRKALNGLEQTYRTETIKLKEALIGQLKNAMDEATKASDLDEAIKLRDAIAGFETADSSPPTSPPNDTGETAAKMRARVAELEALVAKLERQIVQPPQATIPKNAARFQGHSYAVVPNACTWYRAQQLCNSVGGYVVRIESPLEQQFLTQFLSAPAYRESAFWIDGSDADSEGAWKFSNGQKIAHFFWTSGQPNNDNRCQHNIVMVPKNGISSWADTYEGERTAFICEWDK